MSLRFLRDGWYFQTMDATAVTCEWCGASFDATSPDILEDACTGHRRECPQRLLPIVEDQMVPAGYLEVHDADGIVQRIRVGQV